MVAVPTQIYPLVGQLFQVGREQTFATAPAQSAFISIPIAGFMPDNKVTWIEDGSMWGDFSRLHDLQAGPIWQEGDVKESPLYGDTFPALAWNLMGDLVSTGTASTPTWTTSAPLAAGATSIAVTSGSTAVAGTYIQVDTATNAEIVKVGTGSTGTSIVLDPATPLRFSHLTTIAAVTVVAPFSHVVSLLNPASSSGVTTGQGPTHTIIHRTGIPGSGNNNAWQFSYGVVHELVIMGKATGALTWSGKLTSYKKAYPSFNPTAAFSSVKMIPAWRGTTSLASSAVNSVNDWTITLTRELDVIPTADGSQDPYVIARGNCSATFKITMDPALDEVPLGYVLNNTQPTFAQVITNGLSGASLVSLTVNGQLAGFKDAPLKADKALWGWDLSGEFVGSTTNSGNSGGRSPLSLTFVNSIPVY